MLCIGPATDRSCDWSGGLGELFVMMVKTIKSYLQAAVPAAAKFRSIFVDLGERARERVDSMILPRQQHETFHCLVKNYLPF